MVYFRNGRVQSIKHSIIADWKDSWAIKSLENTKEFSDVLIISSRSYKFVVELLGNRPHRLTMSVHKQSWPQPKEEFQRERNPGRYNLRLWSRGVVCGTQPRTDIILVSDGTVQAKFRNAWTGDFIHWDLFQSLDVWWTTIKEQCTSFFPKSAAPSASFGHHFLCKPDFDELSSSQLETCMSLDLWVTETPKCLKINAPVWGFETHKVGW